MSNSYLGAAEGELLGASAVRRAAAYSTSQRRLFPHQGMMRLTPRTLILSGWREVHQDDVAGVRLAFTPAYGRGQAAGARGSNTSFGIFGDLGKPLILDLRDDESLYLLIDFRWFTGINDARHWAPALRRWARTESPAR